MEESRLWLLVFSLVIITGAILMVSLVPLGIDTVVINGVRLLSIFLGMLGGTALGEYLKIRKNEKTGEVLLSDLTEELRVNRELLGKGIPLRKGFWILGVRSGRAEYIPEAERRKLWRIYPVITHYNDDLAAVHRAELTGSPASPEVESEMKRLAADIEHKIDDFLESQDS
ncbi:hypothetical protein EU520_00580 [Candidatus Thorarchaeota archaeon]|nr:MAG: hypothetical protein EU520_00580 [Candidatus Thorarchaeota archaeon]